MCSAPWARLLSWLVTAETGFYFFLKCTQPLMFLNSHLRPCCWSLWKVHQGCLHKEWFLSDVPWSNTHVCKHESVSCHLGGLHKQHGPPFHCTQPQQTNSESLILERREIAKQWGPAGLSSCPVGAAAAAILSDLCCNIPKWPQVS